MGSVYVKGLWRRNEVRRSEVEIGRKTFSRSLFHCLLSAETRKWKKREKTVSETELWTLRFNKSRGFSTRPWAKSGLGHFLF